MNIDIWDKRIIHKLHLNIKSVIIEKRTYAWWEKSNIENRIRLGCNFTFTLFNLFTENTLGNLREEEIEGIQINGMLVYYISLCG